MIPALQVRSYFSFGRGLRSPESWAQEAHSRGYTALSCGDWNNFYGLVRFSLACRKVGIKPLAGVVIAPGDTPLLTAWCLNRRGFERINRMLSRILDKEPGYNPVEDLRNGGWDGLALATHIPEILEVLFPSGGGRIYAALYWGQSFSETVRWARARGIPLLALGSSIALSPQEEWNYRLLRAVSLCTDLESLPPRIALEKDQIFPSPEELQRYFSSVPEAWAAAQTLAQEADTSSLLETSYVFPDFEGMNSSQAFSHLEQLCREGIPRRYTHSSQVLEDRLAYELSIIRTKGFASYFLVVHDIVKRFPRTCGRGSAAASIVSYLLGLTHVDPLKYNLFFERFLNPGRMDPPDIDIDFPWDEREQVLRYVFTRYAGSAAMVADHVTFADRAPWRESAKAQGATEEEIHRYLTLRHLGKSEEIPDYVRRGAQFLQDMPRYLGTHPGGVVIVPGSIYRWAHIQTSPLGWPVLPWEKDAAEGAGLVKIDLLGNRSLAVVRDAMNLVNPLREAQGTKPLTWETFQPYEDPQTLEMVRQGDTLGCFYIESPATRLFLKKMGRVDYELLVVASSIIRPAARIYNELYLERLRGRAWPPLDPDLEEVLKETCGVMVYQEDVSRASMAVAGFDGSQADRLRKILSKKDRESVLEDWKGQFFAGGLARGKSTGVLDQIWEMILSFQGYSFCKPHSASFALVSLKSAWLKRYFPLAFFCSVINNGGGFYSRQVYINALLREGFPVLGPDVNASGLGAGLEGNSLRLGLGQLAEISHRFITTLVESRRDKGPFQNLEDFLVRMHPGLPEARIMIRSGSLDSIAGNYLRPQIFWVFFLAQERSLFPGLPPAPVSIKDYPPGIKIGDEKATTGLIYTQYALDLFEPRARTLVLKLRLPTLVTSHQLSRLVGRTVTLLGLYVTQKEVPTRSREAMAFVSFEDRQGMIETVLFPQAWEQLKTRLWQGMAFLMVGKVSQEWEAITLEVTQIQSLSRQSAFVRQPPSHPRAVPVSLIP
ncbi:MAG: hypothetical protein A2Z96_06680 [Spirochaetes bacterium GWB1_48_6]|nr:MAG: hypothetical protein A2Z96_06680 [Spirochaetes bacterium GWB1_48_6]